MSIQVKVIKEFLGILPGSVGEVVSGIDDRGAWGSSIAIKFEGTDPVLVQHPWDEYYKVVI